MNFGRDIDRQEFDRFLHGEGAVDRPLGDVGTTSSARLGLPKTRGRLAIAFARDFESSQLAPVTHDNATREVNALLAEIAGVAADYGFRIDGDVVVTTTNL